VATSSLEQHVVIGKLLIEADADLELRSEDDDDDWEVPLFEASKGGDYSGQFIKLLTDAGADVDGAGYTNDIPQQNFPIIGAILSIGHKACAINNIKILLEAGVNVNFHQINGYRYDASNGPPTIIKGSTPLHSLLEQLIHLAMRDGYEAIKEYLESVNILVAAGAKIDAKNCYNQTPLEKATNVGYNRYRSGKPFELQEEEKAEKEKAVGKLKEILDSISNT